MSKLLVGYDGSAEAREAARLAARVAECSVASPGPAAAVTVLCVGREPSGFGAALLSHSMGVGGEKTASEGAVLLRSLGVDATARTALGDPATALAEAAARERADALFVGHRGHGRIRSMVLGSVARRLALTAPCPVVVARGPASEALTQILVACDGSPGAQGALDAAITLARLCGARVILLHAVDTAPPAPPSGAGRPAIRRRSHEDDKAHGEAALLSAAECCERAEVVAEVVQTTGPAADVILAQAAERGAQVIALGRSGWSWWLWWGPSESARRSLGRVADAVLRRAGTAILLAGEQLGVVDTAPAVPAPGVVRPPAWTNGGGRRAKPRAA